MAGKGVLQINDWETSEFDAVSVNQSASAVVIAISNPTTINEVVDTFVEGPNQGTLTVFRDPEKTDPFATVENLEISSLRLNYNNNTGREDLDFRVAGTVHISR